MSIASTRKVSAEVPLSERTRGIGKGITESSRQEFITRGSKGMLELSTAKVGRVKLFKYTGGDWQEAAKGPRCSSSMGHWVREDWRPG